MFKIEGHTLEGPPTILALREDSDGINLVVLDGQGVISAHLCVITPEGFLKLYSHAGDVEGNPFKTTECGFIKVLS